MARVKQDEIEARTIHIEHSETPPSLTWCDSSKLKFKSK